jgi:antirestriction protein ArdC
MGLDVWLSLGHDFTEWTGWTADVWADMMAEVKAERARHAALVEAARAFLRRTGGLTLRSEGSREYVRVPNAWIDDLDAALRAALEDKG